MQRVADSDATGPRDRLWQAMAAHRAGRLGEADTLYRRAIQADPGNARALRLRGILARELGDLEASARYLGRAAEVGAGDAEPLAELAVTRMAAGDLAGAESALRGAAGRDPAHAKSLANLGALLQYRGHVEEAIGCHERVLALDPGDVEVRCNLARALVEAGRGDDALAACDDGLALAPVHPLLLAARGAALGDLGRFEDAAAALESAVVRNPDDDMALVNLAYARLRMGQHARAIDALRAALGANPASGRATADLVNLLAGTVQMEEALALAADFLARHPGERQVLAAQAFALRDAGREAEAGALLDFDRLVRVIDLSPPQAFATMAAFNARLCEIIGRDPTLLPGPAGKATRGGSQTGEIDLAVDPALGALRELIETEVRALARALVDGGFASHPAMAYAAPIWMLRAWGTVLDSGGRQAPHIHPLGWLSGVYYAGIPPGMEEEHARAGWIEFGAPPDRFIVTAPPGTRAIEPRPGRLVLFPSYFHHRTLPFEAPGRRISIAFDVVPRR